MRLTRRYQIDENIRTGKYVIPVALNELFVKVALSLLLAYSIFFTDIPIGYDTSHLSHVFDLMFAYQRLFFAICLIVCNEKFTVFRKSRSRIDRMVEQEAAASSKHFAQLKVSVVKNLPSAPFFPDQQPSKICDEMSRQNIKLMFFVMFALYLILLQVS
ncbi:hypothetical protein COOONC_20553 [Cooperia oncophora]